MPKKILLNFKSKVLSIYLNSMTFIFQWLIKCKKIEEFYPIIIYTLIKWSF